MRNLSETETYSFSDHVLSHAIFALSRVVGVKQITKPFWNRWRAALFDQDTLNRFLKAIGGLTDWPVKGSQFLSKEVAQFEVRLPSLSRDESISEYRRLSFLAHLVQWGCLPLSEIKEKSYRLSRDFYLKAEQMAFGERFSRIEVQWEGRSLWGNLHLPDTTLPSGKVPLIVLVHGMDDVKEEHLASELLFIKAGFAVLCMDGPGQGESFLLDGIVWPANFEEAIIASVNALSTHPSIDTDHYSVAGISWGGMWAFKIAAKDPRAIAILDLGGPVDSREFDKLPFFLKSKFCQILGTDSAESIYQAAHIFSIRDESLLSKVKAHVHIVHGEKDPIVSTADKVWLKDTVQKYHPDEMVKLTLYPDGDHCCTKYVTQVREQASVEFMAEYQSRKAQKMDERVAGYSSLTSS